MMPAVPTEPQGIAQVDLRDAGWQARELAGEAARLEFEYTSAPGTVVISAAAASADFSRVFRLPRTDPETLSSSTGGYPWRARMEQRRS